MKTLCSITTVAALSILGFTTRGHASPTLTKTKKAPSAHALPSKKLAPTAARLNAPVLLESKQVTRPPALEVLGHVTPPTFGDDSSGHDKHTPREGRPITLTISDPVQGSASMNFLLANVFNQAHGRTPFATFMPSTPSSQSSYVEFSFETHPDYWYVVGCNVTGARTYFTAYQSEGRHHTRERLPASGGVWQVINRGPGGGTAGRSGMLIAGDGHFSLTECSIVPHRRD